MEPAIRSQRGYLLILAIVLIIIIGFIGTILVYMFIGGTSSENKVALANQALYIATSGMEIAKRDIIVNKVPCAAINDTAKYTAANFANGQFTVTGAGCSNITTLAENINDTDTNPTIVLTDASSFTADGTVKIDNELFYYTAINGNTLLNVKRGVAATAIANHNMWAKAIQIQCTLTAVGAIPTIATPEAKRTIRHVIPPLITTVPQGGIVTTLVALGDVDIKGNTFLANPAVWDGEQPSPDYPGSTIVSAHPVIFAGTAGNLGTKVCGCSTSACLLNCSNDIGLAVSTTVGSYMPDVVQNYAGISIDNLFGLYFIETKAQMKSYIQTPQPTTLYFPGSLSGWGALNNVTGKSIWVDGSISITGNEIATIGSPTSPVTLIINGDLDIGGTTTTTIYGLVYAMGNIKTGGNTNITGMGIFVAEGAAHLAGTAYLRADPSILARLFPVDPAIVVNYQSKTASAQEIFQ